MEDNTTKKFTRDICNSSYDTENGLKRHIDKEHLQETRSKKFQIKSTIFFSLIFFILGIMVDIYILPILLRTSPPKLHVVIRELSKKGSGLDIEAADLAENEKFKRYQILIANGNFTDYQGEARITNSNTSSLVSRLNVEITFPISSIVRYYPTANAANDCKLIEENLFVNTSTGFIFKKPTEIKISELNIGTSFWANSSFKLFCNTINKGGSISYEIIVDESSKNKLLPEEQINVNGQYYWPSYGGDREGDVSSVTEYIPLQK